MKGNGISRNIHYDRAKGILNRCNNAKCKAYKNYGGRGIECRLGNTIEEVISSLEKIDGYKPGLSIDRIDNSGHYEIGNLRWADFSMQNNNRRKFSNDARKNMSIAHIGKTSYMKGRRHKEETKEKISKSMTGKLSKEKHPLYGKKGLDSPLTKPLEYYSSHPTTRDNFRRYCKRTNINIASISSHY